MLNSKQRSKLKSIAAKTETSMNIGKDGYKPELINSLLELFNTREVVKVVVNQNCMEDIRELANVLAERTNSEVVQIIGKKIVFYKENKENKKIIL